MKTLLFHAERGAHFNHQIDTVLALAQKYGSHVIASHVTPSLNIYMPYSQEYMVSDNFSATIIEEWAEIARDTRRIMDENWPEAGPPWEWIETIGNTSTQLAEQARAADLTIICGGDPELPDGSQAWALASDVTLANGLPVLTIPVGSQPPLGTKPVVVAWDGSLEATHAIRQALPMLRMAPKVIVAEIGEDNANELPGADIAPFLARHGIQVQSLNRVPRGSVAEELLDIAHAFDAELIVMGAFGHTRLREIIFGGVTRGMLQRSDTPLFLCH